jgi:hypothetical protein
MARSTDARIVEDGVDRQDLPRGDTGDGDTGVPPDEQGISNRAGDRGDDNAVDDEDFDDDEDEDEEDEESKDGRL